MLRGINVSGQKTVKMDRLKALYEDQGLHAVRTYIQSGNVVFAATLAQAKSIPLEVQRIVEREFDIRSPVVTRSAVEFGAVLDNHPFEGKPVDDRSLAVAFLETKPSKAQAAALDPDRSPGDSFRLIGREIYLSLPNGAARTKLTNAYFDRTLATVSTVRNWRTVNKLADMLAEMSA